MPSSSGHAVFLPGSRQPGVHVISRTYPEHEQLHLGIFGRPSFVQFKLLVRLPFLATVSPMLCANKSVRLAPQRVEALTHGRFRHSRSRRVLQATRASALEGVGAAIELRSRYVLGAECSLCCLEARLLRPNFQYRWSFISFNFLYFFRFYYFIFKFFMGKLKIYI